MDNKINIIVSTLDNRNSGKLGIEEIKEITKKEGIEFSLVKWISYGSALVETECTFEKFSEICDKTFFVRHIFPVDKTYTIEEAIKNIDEDLEKDSFKVSTLGDVTLGIQGFALVDNEHFRKADFAKKINTYFENKNYDIDNKTANYAISFLMTKDTVYIGGSYIKHNLSNWALGHVRYKKGKNLISRASLKLEEAFDTFNLNSNYKKAIDLGASPGGWTKVLADKDILVYAVDPALLDERIKGHKNIKFFNMLSQEFVNKIDENFDLVVNDMKMDVIKSSEIMCELAKIIEPNGIGIMTFKLPEKKQRGKILDGLRVLSKEYEIIKVKQLYHNRQEVTVLFKKKGR